MKKYLVIRFIILLLMTESFAALGQVNSNNLPVVIPAAPNAAALSKYGNLDVGLQTGSLNFKMPLFTVSGKNWNMPVDIQYSTSGVKVDQIASRVGMGMALNAGGVITRSVNGKPDELNTRSTLPSTWNSFDQNFLDYLQNITSSAALDTQPDEFFYNFNGYSGKFVFDASGNVMLIPHANIKIVFTFNSSSSSSFVCTTPDGSQYYFEDMEFTSAGTSCGGATVSVGDNIPTAWYVTKIVLPNKDQVNFTYQNIAHNYISGISQTITRSPTDIQYPCPDLQCPVVDNQSVCMSSTFIMGKQLSNISSKYLSADFIYVSRQDLPLSSPSSNSEKLLSQIVLKQTGETVKTINFAYSYGISATTYASGFEEPTERYRPYLTSFNFTGKNGEPGEKCTFSYNDINGLPPRLSFSQDMQGYFNGKTNSGLVPKPELLADQQFFWRATADRTPDLASTLKGALVKINYPTGGSDSVVYALNDYHTTQYVPQTQTTALSIARTSAFPVVKTSPAFTPYSPYGISLSGSVLLTLGSDGSSPYDPETDLLRIEIIRQSDNVVIYAKTLKAGQGFSGENITGMNSSNSYVLQITSLVADIKCSSTINYPIAPTAVESNVAIAGLRVSKLISTTNAGIPVIKKYYYSSLADLTKSSGNTNEHMQLFGLSSNYIYGVCIIAPGSVQLPTSQKCSSRVAYSSSVASLFPYSQNHVYYSSVIEGLGEDFENGGTQHAYIVDADAKSIPLHGPVGVPGVKLTNNGFKNGLETEQLTFKKSSGGFVVLKKATNTYKADTTTHASVTAYAIADCYGTYPQHHSPPIYEEFDGFQIDQYKFYSAWVYQDTSTVTTYDQSGTLPVTTQTLSYYANPLHSQLTASSTINSKGQLLLSTSLYPHEMVSLSRDPTGVYQQMINNNIITPVIESKQYNNSVQTGLERTNYYQPYTGKFVPQLIESQRGASDIIEARIQYSGYDSLLNVLSVLKSNGPLIGYHWGYQKVYPVAECKNAGDSEFYYQSFEESMGTGIQTGSGHTGHKYSTTPALVSWTLPNARAYLISYWYLDSGNWKYSGEQPFTGAFTMRTASGYDDIRIHPADAQMTTYTYDPLVGMTTATDAKGQTAYYEYDGLQRLINVRDDEGKVLKHMDYHYKGQ
jgi:YD repeat-containing protein